MAGRRPLIGITSAYDYDKCMSYIKDGYYEGVFEAGGLPVLIPVLKEAGELEDLIDSCHGFLVSGGPDMDAKYFGENNLEYNGDISPYRDSMELYICRKAVEHNKPILGICRGIQLMNVALGGSLYQDIDSQLKGRLPLKHSQSAPRWYPTHEIRIEKGSRAFSWFGEDSAGVNSFHHQAVKDIAPDFKVTSKSPDGIIESIEHISCKFAVGVQWHPEVMWQKDRKFLSAFENLVGACRE